MNYKMIENELIPIYENENKEKLINARELFISLRGENTKTKFMDWIKNRIEKYQFIENEDFIRFRKFTKGDKNGFGNKTIIEYYLNFDTAKEIAIYETEDKEKLGNRRKFADWMKQRIGQYEFVENEDYICFHNFVKAEKYGNKTMKDYYLKIDVAKERAIIENNEL